MKKVFFLSAGIFICILTLGQGKSGDKGKSKDKNKSGTEQSFSEKEKEKKESEEHEWKIWEGTFHKEGDGPKPSKNQPAKVRAAFQRDYPNARNVRWSKFRGDWTATFGNGLFRSTAVYHANGDRRDTRTLVTRNELPRVVLDSIFKKRPGIDINDVIRVEVPNVIKEIFRIKNIVNNQPEYLYFDREGVSVNYDY